MRKFCRLACFVIIVLANCTTRYLRSDYQTKPISGSTHEIGLIYSGFWGISGVGVVADGDGFMVVTELRDNFPAHKGGIHRNDVILEIDAQSTQGKSIEKVIDMFRGEADSYIRLKVRRHLVGYGQIGGKYEKDTVLDFSYRRGISNGLECIQSPQTIIKGVVCEFEKVERQEIRHFEKKNFLSGTQCLFGYIFALIGGPGKFSEIGKIDTTYHNLGHLKHETFTISTQDNSVTRNIKSDGEGIVEISLKDFCYAAPEGRDLVLEAVRAKDGARISSDIVVQTQYLEVVRENENKVAYLVKQASALHKQGRYSKAISLYQQIRKEYPATEIVLTGEINDHITRIKNEETVATLRTMSNKNLDFLLGYGLSSFEVLSVYLILDEKLKDEIRMIAVTDGLNIKVKDAAEAWRIYNGLSSRQKLYALLRLAEMAGGVDPLYKKLILKDWIYYAGLAEKLSYVESSKLLTEP